MTEVNKLAYKLYIRDGKKKEQTVFLVEESFVNSVEWSIYFEKSLIILRNKKLKKIMKML